MTDQPIQIEDVKRLVVAPGDTIILRLDRRGSAEEMHVMQESMRAMVSPDVNVIVLDNSISMEVVRPGAAA